jgi:hypothetical protein
VVPRRGSSGRLFNDEIDAWVRRRRVRALIDRLIRPELALKDVTD